MSTWGFLNAAEALSKLASVTNYDEYRGLVDDLYFLFHESLGSRLDGRISFPLTREYKSLKFFAVFDPGPNPDLPRPHPHPKCRPVQRAGSFDTFESWGKQNYYPIKFTAGYSRNAG